MSSNIDGFEGTPLDYISYLESVVISLRRRRSSCPTWGHPRDATRQQTPVTSSPLKRPRELQIIQYDPTIDSRAQTSQEREPKKKRPQWKEQALTLIRETPDANTWMTKLKEKGIFDAMCSGNAVSSLLLLDEGYLAPIEPTLSTTQVRRCASPLARIENYARVSMQREISASMATALANFQKFLVLSSCAVLLETGTTLEDAYRVVRICIGNDATNEHCRRILRGCQFVHELMDNLYMSGWGLRAFELLLICKLIVPPIARHCSLRTGNKTPAFYCTVSYAYEAGLILLKSSLSKQELMVDVQPNRTDWTSIFPPKIIHNILGEDVE